MVNNNTTPFCILWTITQSLATVVGNNKINNDTKSRQIAGDFNHHADAAVQCGAHHPMEHIQGFTRRLWMPPSGKCLSPIAPLAAIVSSFIVTHKTLTKNYC